MSSIPVAPLPPPAAVPITGLKKSVGYNGSNQTDDVRQVQQLLIQAGAGLTVTGVSTPALVDAIKQYQYNWDGTPDGRVDPNGSTWKKLVQGELQVLPAFIQLPDPSVGYYCYAQRAKQYGTPMTIVTLIVTSLQFYLKTQVQVGAGEISQATPGHFGSHKTHYKGRAADLRPIRKDGAQTGVSCTSDDYSRENTKILVETLLAHANVESILFNDSEIPGVSYCDGHHDHLHVYFKA